ncbi:hypothetical protein B4N84_23390 [Flavobacterium sp. IR1]|nr:hypothetical protein B4N84_23390 [Flavobacterium sp. IR1]
MKIIVLYFCLFFGLANAQNSNKKQDLFQKKIESCRIVINDSVSIFKIHENIQGNDVDVVVKTENEVIEKCLNQNVTDEILKATAAFQNPLIKINNHLINGLNIVDYPSLVPQKISVLKRNSNTVLVIELYNVSYSTVGNTYINLGFKIDSKGEVIEKKILESKLPVKFKKYYQIF